jgi:hypothetical protein
VEEEVLGMNHAELGGMIVPASSRRSRTCSAVRSLFCISMALSRTGWRGAA